MGVQGRWYQIKKTGVTAWGDAVSSDREVDADPVGVTGWHDGVWKGMLENENLFFLEPLPIGRH